MIVIGKWPGLITNASPYTLPPGAAVTQVNVQVIRPGELAARSGLAAVTWSSIDSSTSPVRRIFRAPCGGQERLVYQDAAGAVRLAAGPS
jgi:hypothetical protein